MNQQPHTHQLKITRNPYMMTKPIEIKYGDQKTRRVQTWLPGWQGRLKRKIKKIVARHDRESQRAHLAPKAVAESLQKEYNRTLLEVANRAYGDTYAKERQDAWGADLLKEIPKQTAPVAAK